MIREMLFSTVFLSFFSSNAQETTLPVDEKTGKVTYTAIVNQEGTKQDLFKRLEGWFNSYYKNPSGVIQESDTSTGKITGKHKFNLFKIVTDKKGVEVSRTPDGGIIQYIVTIEVKEGKYRYHLSEILLLGSTKTPVEEWLNDGNEMHAENLNQISVFMDDLIASLKKSMAISPETGGDQF